MFVLRKISKDGVCSNFALGKVYTYVNKKNNLDLYLITDKRVGFGSSVYGFVDDQQGNSHILLVEEQAFIMSENGKTFENISPNKVDIEYNKEMSVTASA